MDFYQKEIIRKVEQLLVKECGQFSSEGNDFQSLIKEFDILETERDTAQDKIEDLREINNDQKDEIETLTKQVAIIKDFAITALSTIKVIVSQDPVDKPDLLDRLDKFIRQLKSMPE